MGDKEFDKPLPKKSREPVHEKKNPAKERMRSPRMPNRPKTTKQKPLSKTEVIVPVRQSINGRPATGSNKSTPQKPTLNMEDVAQ